jgi:hypothetical protein
MAFSYPVLFISLSFEEGIEAQVNRPLNQRIFLLVRASLNERPDALHEFLSHPQDAGGVLVADMDELLVR